MSEMRASQQSTLSCLRENSTRVSTPAHPARLHTCMLTMHKTKFKMFVTPNSAVEGEGKVSLPSPALPPQQVLSTVLASKEVSQEHNTHTHTHTHTHERTHAQLILEATRRKMARAHTHNTHTHTQACLHTRTHARTHACKPHWTWMK